MTFKELRQLPEGEIKPAVPCRAIRDLHWSDGRQSHLHAASGTKGEINFKTAAGFLVTFENGERRQVLDFQDEHTLYQAEEQIELTAD